MVAREDSSISSCFVEAVNCSDNSISQRIDKTNSSNECELSLNNLSRFFSLKLIIISRKLCEFVTIEITVSKSDWLLPFFTNCI